MTCTTNTIRWLVLLGVVFSSTFVLGQTGAQVHKGLGRNDRGSTGPVVLSRTGAEFNGTNGDQSTTVISRENVEKLSGGPAEPPKLRPLNRIDVRATTSNKLSAPPAAAQPASQNAIHGTGSANKTEGKTGHASRSGPGQNRRLKATLVTHDPTPRIDGTTGAEAAGDTGEYPDGYSDGDTVFRQPGATPHVSRRPLPNVGHALPTLPAATSLGGTVAVQAKGSETDEVIVLPELPTVNLDPPSLSHSPSLNTPSLNTPALNTPASQNYQVQSTNVATTGSITSQFQRGEDTNSPAFAAKSQLLVESESSLRDSNRLQMRSPRVQVAMEGPAQVAIGIPQKYTIKVSNLDSQNLEGLVLRVEVPQGIKVSPESPTHGQCQIESQGSGASLINWDFENLVQNGNAALPVELTAETTSDFSVTVEWTFQPFSSVAAMQVLSPRLELSLEGPSEVNYGQPSTYRLKIRNPGNADANDISLTLNAQQYGSSSTVINRIPAGGEESMEVELTFRQSGSIRVAADARAAGNLSSKSEVQVLVRQAQLDLYWDSPEVAYHGSAVPYLLQLKNSGDAPADQVRVEIQLPEGATVVAVPQDAKLENGKLFWTVPAVGPGSLEELSLHLAFHREGENQLAASCSHSAGTSVESRTMTLVQAITDLKLMVSDPAAPAMAGGEVIYEMTLENRGSKTAESVNLVALFSKDIEPIRAEGLVAKIFPGQVRFDTVPQLRPGEAINVKVYAIAELAGMHRFRAEVNTANTEIKLVQEETTQYIESVRRTAKSGESSLVR